MPDLIYEHQTQIRTSEGAAYLTRSYAELNPDGMWEAWLEFHPIDGKGPVLKTDTETSQATRAAIDRWASGLEPVYFEGAFARAQRVPAR
jgi:hypothetical protein